MFARFLAILLSRLLPSLFTNPGRETNRVSAKPTAFDCKLLANICSSSVKCADRFSWLYAICKILILPAKITLELLAIISELDAACAYVLTLVAAMCCNGAVSCCKNL